MTTFHDITDRLQQLREKEYDKFESKVGKHCRVIFDKHICADFPDDEKYVDRTCIVLDCDYQDPPIYYVVFDDDKSEWSFFDAMLREI